MLRPLDAWVNASVLAARRARAKRLLPELERCQHEFYASLSDYATVAPQKFFKRSVFNSSLRVLREIENRDQGAVARFLESERVAVDSATRILDDINLRPIHDRTWDSKPAYIIRDVGELVHPAYLQLLESVLKPFLTPAAIHQRTKRGVTSTQFTFEQRFEEAKQAGIDDFECVDVIIRNAIAHGSIHSTLDQIEYLDQHGSKRRARVETPFEALRIFEDLLDICNALVLATRVFVVMHKTLLLDTSIALPKGLLFPEAAAQVEMDGWRLDSTLDLRYAEGRRELYLFASSDYLDDNKAGFMMIRTAVAGAALMRGFDSYVVQLERRNTAGGVAIFDAPKLSAIFDRPANSTYDYLEACPPNGFILFPWSRRWIVSRHLRLLGTFREMFSLRRQAKQLSRANLINVRFARRYAKDGYTVVIAQVVIEHETAAAAAIFVRARVDAIIRRSISAAARDCRWVDRLLPVGYVAVDIFTSDLRQRHLKGSGLRSELLCRIVKKTRGKINDPPLYGSLIDLIGSVRIEWNRAAVESALSRPV